MWGCGCVGGYGMRIVSFPSSPHSPTVIKNLRARAACHLRCDCRRHLSHWTSSCRGMTFLQASGSKLLLPSSCDLSLDLFSNLSSNKSKPVSLPPPLCHQIVAVKVHAPSSIRQMLISKVHERIYCSFRNSFFFYIPNGVISCKVNFIRLAGD